MQKTRPLAIAAAVTTALALALITPQTASAAWTKTSSFTAGVQPGAIAVDSSSNTVYVGGYAGKGIRAVNGTSHKVIATYKSSHKNNVIQDLATDPVHHYVVAADHHGAMIVNEATKAVKEVAWRYDANGVAIDPGTGLIFLGGSDEEGTDYLSEFTESTGALVWTTEVTVGVAQIAVNTATHKVYLAGYNTGAVSVVSESSGVESEFSAASGNCASSTGGCGPAGIAVNAATGMLYVSNNEPNDGTNFISVINTATNGIVTEIPVFTKSSESNDAPGYMAVNAATNTVYSVDYGPLVVIDGATNAVIKNVALGKHDYNTQLATVAVNSTTGVAYVASGQLTSKAPVYSVANVPLKLSSSTPKISGKAVVNGTLTATAGRWTNGTSLAYQWKIAGVPVVSGGTGTTYTVKPSDVGKKITVRVTGSQAGYATKAVTSASTKKVASAPFAADPIPTIGGTLTVNSILTATAAGWSPTATFTYKWYRSGKKITGAKGQTYTLVAKDHGKKITVKVTGSAVGYTTTTKSSAATGAIS